MNMSSNGTDNTPYDLSRSVWYWLIRGIIAFLTVAGNGWVIYLIVKIPRLHLTPNWFLLNLLVSDFCVGIVNFPLGITCKFLVKCTPTFSFPVLNAFLNASVTSLCLMTLDRYLAVVRPFRYQGYMTKSRVLISIITSWFVACGMSFLYFALDKEHAQLYTILYLAILEIAPALFLSSAYTHMVIIGRRHLKRVTNMMAQLNFNYGGKSSGYRSNERSAVKVIGSVTALFIISYSLSVYLTVQIVIFDNKKQPDILLFISTVMVHFNSAVNFVVYALFKSDLRREMMRTFQNRRIRAYESTDGPYRLSFMSSQRTTTRVATTEG